MRSSREAAHGTATCILLQIISCASKNVRANMPGMPLRLRSLALALPLALATIAAAPSADAFCGFYVAGADEKLFNNATMVVLMREGTRTVLSMQNNYQGPPENFAMVVPVPVVLQKEHVKTLPMAVFDKVDKLASPRLVEYWEQDPCAPEPPHPPPMPRMRMAAGARPEAKSASAADLGVTIEAQFTVGEYEVLILSARDSAGLDTWLRQEKYKIPAGSEPLLRPRGEPPAAVGEALPPRPEWRVGIPVLLEPFVSLCSHARRRDHGPSPFDMAATSPPSGSIVRRL